LETSDKAFLRTDPTNTSAKREETDGEEKNYTLGLLATKKIDDTKVSKLIIYSSGAFAADVAIGDLDLLLSDLYYNRSIVTSAVNYLNDRDDIISISKVYDDTSYLDVTEAQHYRILAVIFITPIVIIAAGIVVWQIRRRKK